MQKYLVILFLGVVAYPGFRNYFEDKGMAFFWWVLGILALFGIAYVVEYLCDFLISWPFEE